MRGNKKEEGERGEQKRVARGVRGFDHFVSMVGSHF